MQRGGLLRSDLVLAHTRAVRRWQASLKKCGDGGGCGYDPSVKCACRAREQEVSKILARGGGQVTVPAVRETGKDERDGRVHASSCSPLAPRRRPVRRRPRSGTAPTPAKGDGDASPFGRVESPASLRPPIGGRGYEQRSPEWHKEHRQELRAKGEERCRRRRHVRSAKRAAMESPVLVASRSEASLATEGGSQDAAERVLREGLARRERCVGSKHMSQVLLLNHLARLEAAGDQDPSGAKTKGLVNAVESLLVEKELESNGYHHMWAASHRAATRLAKKETFELDRFSPKIRTTRQQERYQAARERELAEEEWHAAVEAHALRVKVEAAENRRREDWEVARKKQLREQEQREALAEERAAMKRRAAAAARREQDERDELSRVMVSAAINRTRQRRNQHVEAKRSRVNDVRFLSVSRAQQQAWEEEHRAKEEEVSRAQEHRRAGPKATASIGFKFNELALGALLLAKRSDDADTTQSGKRI